MIGRRSLRYGTNRLRRHPGDVCAPQNGGTGDGTPLVSRRGAAEPPRNSTGRIGCGARAAELRMVDRPADFFCRTSARMAVEIIDAMRSTARAVKRIARIGDPAEAED